MCCHLPLLLGLLLCLKLCCSLLFKYLQGQNFCLSIIQNGVCCLAVGFNDLAGFFLYALHP